MSELLRPGDAKVFIYLDAFVRDILQGDGEWFERIAKRELQKLKHSNRTNLGDS
jgi:hypothetical protein